MWENNIVLLRLKFARRAARCACEGFIRFSVSPSGWWRRLGQAVRGRKTPARAQTDKACQHREGRLQKPEMIVNTSPHKNSRWCPLIRPMPFRYNMHVEPCTAGSVAVTAMPRLGNTSHVRHIYIRDCSAELWIPGKNSKRLQCSVANRQIKIAVQSCEYQAKNPNALTVASRIGKTKNKNSGLFFVSYCIFATPGKSSWRQERLWLQFKP